VAAFVHASAEIAEVDDGQVVVPDVALDVFNNVLAHFSSRADFVPDEPFWDAMSKAFEAADCEQYLPELREQVEDPAYLNELIEVLRGWHDVWDSDPELESEEEGVPADLDGTAASEDARRSDDESLLAELAAELELPEAGAKDAKAVEEDERAAAAARATAEAAERVQSATAGSDVDMGEAAERVQSETAGSDVDMGESDVRGCGGTPAPALHMGPGTSGTK
jgi:hypothetical protein